MIIQLNILNFICTLLVGGIASYLAMTACFEFVIACLELPAPIISGKQSPQSDTLSNFKNEFRINNRDNTVKQF